jgi:hypothetical protein
MLKLALVILIIPVLAFAQVNEEIDIWSPVNYFIGTWTGISTGKAGEGAGERTYGFIMDGTYLHYKNVMTFAPQEKNPKGEVHEDWAFFSFDKSRDRLIMRQFNVEGFVNTFVLDSLLNEDKNLILISESSENSPPGLRAKYTLEIQDENSFVEIFELGFPEREFSCWMTNTWQRQVSE